ncbi:PAAR domain-containing protein [Enterobacter cloacae complex sp. ECC445]|uniref:PAAR domain-containing protein n=1 Tax=Enterobacter cloacae complex sp. ECC445 TaxID=2913213 RepID=UPI001F1706F9|nr:PAAR domain-containing protein [Enterobacter cloacae complex sp. ECC445]MCG0456926.1 PAAR domain-containing protein [Enterobacter cloacae complex sp. ECC445]
MATGHFLRIGDKTTCGGSILSGSPNHSFGGIATARNGDSVSCGKDGKVYHIAGGIPTYSIHGVAAAGTLHSRSTCPCNASFISSFPNASYWVEEKKAVKAVPVVTAAPLAAPVPTKAEEPVQHAQTAKKPHKEETKREPVDAGFCVLPYGAETGAYERYLFEGSSPAGTKELYRSLNGEGKEYKAGSIMLLVDPEKQDDEQIAHMQSAKQRIDTALEPLTHQEANFLHNHYGTIANFSNIADKGIGLAADPVGKYFENIEKILKEIQETYKNTYMTRGALIGEQFYVRRAQLFKELERELKVGFLNKAMKFGEYTKIKNALGLSTSSITHKWNETGISDIEGYATHIERAAKYVAAMRYVGYVGIGFSALHSINEINEACSVGREDECTKKKYTEIGSFAGSTGGGILAGGMAVPLCIAIGVGTAGTGGLVCAVIAGGTLGYVGGEAGGWGGEQVGNTLYNVIEGTK